MKTRAMLILAFVIIALTWINYGISNFPTVEPVDTGVENCSYLFDPDRETTDFRFYECDEGDEIATYSTFTNYKVNIGAVLDNY